MRAYVKVIIKVKSDKKLPRKDFIVWQYLTWYSRRLSRTSTLRIGTPLLKVQYRTIAWKLCET